MKAKGSEYLEWTLLVGWVVARSKKEERAELRSMLWTNTYTSLHCP